jgi:DNA-binding NarL/FixJ family response regulator
MRVATSPHLLLIDDHAVVREGVVGVLRRHWPAAVLRESASLAQARQILAQGPPPDLVLLDLHLPETDPLSAPAREVPGVPGLLDNLRQLRVAQPLVPVLVFSGVVDAELAVSCLHLGASGYLPKSADTAVMVHAIELVLDGGLYLPPFLAGVSTAPPTQPALTPRQYDVLRCLVQGMANKEIARALDLAEPTVKAHLVSIFRLLKVKNRAQAVLAGRDLLALSAG